MKILVKRIVAMVMLSVMLLSILPAQPVNAENTATLKYLYIDQDYLEENETQNIVAVLDVEETLVQKIVLSLENEEGDIISLETTECIDGVAKFSVSPEKGIYHVIDLKVITDNVEEILLEDYGIQAYFGVGKEFSGEKSAHVEVENIDFDLNPEVEMAVMSIDTEEDIEPQANKNWVIVLDPGHDSGHAGAQKNGIQEEVATLKIAQYCKEELEKYPGVTVYLTRETAACPFPETIGVSSGNILDIQKRVEWAATKGADAFISFHLNSAVTTAAKGAEVYYPSGSAEGKELAQKIQNELVALGLYDRKIKANDEYAVIYSSKKYGFPGLIIEHAFVSNEQDANTYLKTDEALKKLGIADATGIANYFNLGEDGWVESGNGIKYKENGTFVTNSWKYIKKIWYYFDANGYMQTGWLTQGNNKYYLNADGEMQIGWVTIEGKTYYFCASGEMVTGWVKVDGSWYYMNQSGHMQTGWLTQGNNKYYLTESGAAATGFVLIDGNTYYFDANAYMQFGWTTIRGVKYYFNTTTGVLEDSELKGWKFQDGKWYYFDVFGTKQTGWIEVDGVRYYLDGSGVMQTGWVKVEGFWYYMNQSGAMQTGWFQEDGNRFYLTESGAAATGFNTIDGAVYYFDADCYMKTGWQTIGGVKYYFNEKTGVLENSTLKGWKQQNGKWYYYDMFGKVVTGWLDDAGARYYLNASGAMQTGWVFDNNIWYYMNSSGAMQTGWVKVGGAWYYMNQAGEMQTGWLEEGGNKFYLTESGAAATGFRTIDESVYYFDANCYMQTGWKTISGVRYYFNEETGVLEDSGLKGWKQQSGKWYYYDALGKKVTDWVEDAGVRYYMNASGVMQTGWVLDNNIWYYMNRSGEMQTGWVKVGEAWYYLNQNGEMQTGWVKVGEAWYYMNQAGEMQTGWLEIEGKKYYLNSDGERQTGSQVIDGVEYYFNQETGALEETDDDEPEEVQSGWEYQNGKWYYLNADGTYAAGWKLIDDVWYYFNSSYEMQTGWVKISGKWYYFESSGAWVDKGSVEGTYLIEQPSTVTVEQMVAYYNNTKNVYPAEKLGVGGAPDLETFCQIFMEEATAEGIAVEVAFTQAMKETGWLKFGGSVKIEQFNFAGIGAVNAAAGGADFSVYGEEGVRMGIRAQIQHLKAYASETITESTLAYPCVDPRFKYVVKGTAKYVEWLGQKENPEGYGWATSENYGTSILEMINKLRNTKA